MKEMTFREKLDLIKACILVADWWEVEPGNLIGFTAIGADEKRAEWNSIAEEVQEFYEMDLDGRAKKMGLNLVKVEEE